jgi:SAM-dependent methyltransferase
VFNSSFKPELMTYDGQYQNEQAISEYFDAYLNELVNLLYKKGFSDKKVIEIGCGKGKFIEKLWRENVDAIGFDPAYEGNDNRVIKDYFSDKYRHLSADLVVLRHTLEHVRDPLGFLHSIGQALDYKGKIFIEVPCLEWIIKNKAFWDIFYEHCNYFTKNSLCNIFEDVEHEFLFNGQYMYVLADLASLREKAKTVISDDKVTILNFDKTIQDYIKFVDAHDGLIVWGGGAKGSTFVNITDPDNELISCVVDINPKKANNFVARSAHRIVSPNDLNKFDSHEVLVMNENYYEEIRAELDEEHYKVFVLGQ